MQNLKIQEFRYTKREIFAPLLGVFGVLFLWAFFFYMFFSPRFSYIHKRGIEADYPTFIFLSAILLICIFHLLYMWLRRRQLLITTDDKRIAISKFGKTEEIEWKIIDSYVYQCGHPFWFLSLRFKNSKPINIHGKLQNFEALINIIKENVKCNFNEFQYTIRRKMDLYFLGFILLCIAIGLIYPGKIHWNKNSIFAIVTFVLLPWIIILFDQFRRNWNKIIITKEGLKEKPLIGMCIFIPWSDITSSDRIELSKVQVSLVAKLWKLTIRSDNKAISFHEDLDNVDDLLNIIQKETGIMLGV